MALNARGVNYYTDYTVYGVGLGANTDTPMSGSTIHGPTPGSAPGVTSGAGTYSGSYEIVQTDDIFLDGQAFDTGGVNSNTFYAIDPSEVTLGGTTSTPGYLSFSVALTGKQLICRLRKVNDR